MRLCNCSEPRQSTVVPSATFILATLIDQALTDYWVGPFACLCFYQLTIVISTDETEIFILIISEHYNDVTDQDCNDVVMMSQIYCNDVASNDVTDQDRKHT